MVASYGMPLLKPANPNPQIGESGYVVLRMAHKLEPGKHKLFFDNFFSSPELLLQLKRDKVFAVGTLRLNRSRKCPLTSEKDMKKMGRGSIEEVVDDSKQLVVCSWFDHKRVLTISNFVGKNDVGQCNRYDRKEKKQIAVDRPKCIEIYNKFMGRVDKADMLLALYKSKCKTRKWYHRIFFHLVSLSAVNSWVVYRQLGGEGHLLDFLMEICSRLVHAAEEPEEMEPVAKRRSGIRSSYVPQHVRYDQKNYWPIQIQGTFCHCKREGCERRTRFMCSKCQVTLRVVGSKLLY